MFDGSDMISVKKMDGSIEPYDESKLRTSLAKAGADNQAINSIILKLGKILYKGIETKKLYAFALKELKRQQPGVAPRYDLKNSILKLSYEGFAFEKLVARILENQRYKTILNQTVQGKLIMHEIDVTAIKDKEKVMVECKHHINPWLGCHIQTPLYVYARFLEVKEQFTTPMLVTNTKFSDQVIVYSNGMGIRLMGWSYPKENSLSYNVEKFKLYPITMIPNLNRSQIEILIDNNIILMSDILSKENEINRILNVDRTQTEKILKEAETLSYKI